MDYLEVVLPGHCSWSRRFEEVRQDLRSLDPQIQFRRNKDYRAEIDMRNVMDIDAKVFYESKFRGDHKIVILQVGEKGFEQTLDIISQITDEHPLPLENRRVDLCANTPDVPVSWYASTIRAECKQWEARIGTAELMDGEGKTMQWAEMGRRVLQTIYLGRRPNCFRIYDKTAEQHVRYLEARRKHLKLCGEIPSRESNAPDSFLLPRKDGESEKEYAKRNNRYCGELRKERREALLKVYPFPDFETWNGAPRSAVLTRVEREMAGGRVPEKLDRVYKLKQSLVDFNPFARLTGFDSGASLVLDPSDFYPDEWIAGVKMWELVSSGEWSRSELYQFLNRGGHGAGLRLERKYRPFLEAATRKTAAVTAQQLYENYRETVTRQLAA